MTFTLDESRGSATDTVGGASHSTTTTDTVHRSGRGARIVLAVLALAMAVAAVTATVDARRSNHDHVASESALTAHGETYSVAVEPPLPGRRPAGPFDPGASVANYDASVAATVADSALVFSEAGGPPNRLWADLPAGYELRALSTSGTKAALVHYDVDAAGRVVGSDILIAERPPAWPVDPATVNIHHLDGLVEPEAFATDGRSLFVIDHQAGSEPGTYRVRPLDLETGQLEEMLGPDKQPLIEDMNGAGRRQVWGLGDGRLYTLYIRQTDHVHASGRPGTDGFVHILDLDEEWAFCLDLPPSFGKGDLATTALAVGSRTVAVLDLSAGEGGQLAYASTVDRAVTEVIDLPLSFRQTMKAMLVAAGEQPGRPPGWQPTVHLAMHGTSLAVGVGEALVWFDGATLEPLVDDLDQAYDERVELDGPLYGLTTLTGSGVLAWTIGGEGPEQLTPPRTTP
ncbi:MAG: hypothetical protein OEZ14_05205 [Acidimicrobiia bacterium]|nr:hypothetical protein [Acidimicrobiia bacterium]MDH5519914.1 hypothetical protein [Acidimicrobiia bacterium]